MKGYIPSLTKIGTKIDMLNPSFLAEGVFGYAVRHKDGRIYIPDIRTQFPSKGYVSRFLDSLDSSCCIVNVMSGKLRYMLKRKGWIVEYEDGCDVWQKPIKF